MICMTCLPVDPCTVHQLMSLCVFVVRREWYERDAVTTKDGNLVITVTQQPLHDLNFRSAMVQSWNKLCFQGGYIEVRLALPGSADHGGFWPGAWTMGNLGRAGHGATNDGVWPL